MADPPLRYRLLRAALVERLDAMASTLADPTLGSVRVTVRLGRDGVPRSVAVEPEFHVESERAR